MAHSGPTVTVLLPVYNGVPFLQDTLDSILSQDLEDLELLAIDDASTDGSREILRACKDPRLRTLEHPVNRGLVASLNEGLDAARGRYIARMDGDDRMLPERLSKQVAHLDAHPEVAVLASFVEYINSDGEVTGHWPVDRATADERAISAMLPRTNCIAHPSVMIRRSALGGLRYDPRQQGAEDWDLWLRMRSRGLRITKLPEVLLQYRQHPGSMMGIEKRSLSYERRLMRTRHRHLVGEWGRGHFSRTQLPVMKAQLRTLARHLRHNVITPLLRDLYRTLSYSPLKLIGEERALRNAERHWRGSHVLLFPYLSTGGAEQVHADILSTLDDRSNLVVVCGSSTDRAFEATYAKHALLLELPRLLHHPFTRRKAHERLAQLINAQDDAVVFSSLNTSFFDLLPSLRPSVRTHHLQHAFLHQPDGNLQHRGWLRHFDRVDAYVFVSRQAMDEFANFLFANHVPRSHLGKLHLIPNAVHRFGEVREHQRTGLLFVGRPSPEKRLELFLRISDALELRAPGRFRATVAGTGSLPGHPKVVFTGIVQDPDLLSGIYADHDLLVLTSSREGFPMVVLEAMAQGLAVLATPVGDIPNRLDDRCAVIASSTEATAVVHELTEAALALDKDRTRLQAMKAAALDRSRNEADPSLFRARYRSLLINPRP